MSHQSVTKYIRQQQIGRKEKLDNWNESFINRLGVTYELKGNYILKGY